MKTKEYIKKYKLNESDKFNHNAFVGDLAIDFIATVEAMRQKSSEFNKLHFEQCVNQIKAKWDGINNKTVGFLPESLWNYFYATVVVESKKDLFPEDQQRREKIENMSDQELVNFINSYDGFYFSVPKERYFDFDQRVGGRDWARAQKLNNELLMFALGELDARFIEFNEVEKEERERRWKEDFNKWQEQRRKQQEWFNRILFGALFSGMSVPSESFKLLGLETSAGEEEIKKAYRTLSMKHHPDKGGNQQMFIDITEAKNKCIAYVNNKSAT